MILKEISGYGFFYLHPDHVEDELIDSILSLSKVVDYFDIPVQSGSDEILKRMGRSKNSRQLRDLLLGIREKHLMLC